MNRKSIRRVVVTPLNVMLVFLLTAVAPQQAFGPPLTQAGQAAASAQPTQIPLDLFKVPDGFSEQDGVNCAGFGTGRCVDANLVFGPLSDDDMCIVPAAIYDPTPGAPPETACDPYAF